MKQADGSKPRITGLKCQPLCAAPIACVLLLMSLFMIVGCGPLVTTDPQSGLPYDGSKTDTVSAKTWPVEQTLVSNEVNCIAADVDNVWIATARGVSRWDRQQDKWLHYTMEDGLSNDMVNAVAVDGQWVWFATDEGVSRYDMQTDTFTTFRTIDGLASDQVSSVAVDGNYVWFWDIRGIESL